MIDRLPADLKVEERDLMPPALWRRFKEVGPQTHLLDPLVICRYYSHYGRYNWFGIEFHQSIHNFFWGLTLFPKSFSWGCFNFDNLTRFKEVHYEVRLDTDFEEEPVSAIMGYMNLENKDCSGAHNALATRLRLAVKYLDAVAV